MDMQNVRGARRNLVSVGWEHNILRVHFAHGQTYQYGGVPQDVRDKLLRVPYPDKLFSQLVRGKYVSERVDTPPSKPITPYPIDWPNLPF